MGDQWNGGATRRLSSTFGLAPQRQLLVELEMRTRTIANPGVQDRATTEMLDDVRNDLWAAQFAVQGRYECLPVTLSDLGPLSWRKVERLEAPRPEAGSTMAGALSGLCLMRVPAVLVISSARSGHGGLHVGLRCEDREAARWLEGVLAPGTLMLDAGEPAVLGRRAEHSAGVFFRTVSGSDQRPGETGLPGLSRLLLNPGDDWAVVLRLDPVPPSEAHEFGQSVLDLVNGLSRFGTVSGGRDQQAQVAMERPVVQALVEDLRARIAHVNAGLSVGLWNTSIWTIAAQLPGLAVVTGAVSSVLRSEPLVGNRWVAERCRTGGGDLPAPATLVSTEDVVQFLTPGTSSLPGLDVAAAPPGGRRELPAGKPLRVGAFAGTSAPLDIDLQDLEGHAFVTGTTGMGKSTTVQRILLDVWNRHQVKFLIVDPVKADYEELAPAVSGGLTVIDATELRLNVLEPFPGFPIRTHLELVANAFKGSFSLPSPVPYVVAQLFEQLVERSAIEPGPTLHDLRDMLDPYVEALGYDGEIASNIRASLGLRLSLLLSPAKAERMAAPTSSSLNDIFERPTVVQLSTLGDDEERAFLMSVLTLYVAERARVRGRAGGAVRHVTVLEEAHRILPEPSTGGSSEEGDAAGVSAKLLTQMLAEIRSYGEAVIVVDQSPAAVARDVVRNTNLKISHRLPDPADRDVIGGALGLPDDLLPSLSRLRRGEVLLSTRRTGEAQTIAVEAPAEVSASPGTARTPQRRSAEDPRACCSGRFPVLHHAAEAHARDAEAAIAPAVNAALNGTELTRTLHGQTRAALHRIAAGQPSLAGGVEDAARCLAYAGMRRALLRHVAYGQVDDGEVGRRLRQVFTWWDKPALGTSLSAVDLDVATGPYHGCRWCPAVCGFRHLGEVSATHGRAALRVAMRPTWNTPTLPLNGRLARWRQETVKTLEPILGGVPAAEAAAHCTLTQFAAEVEMPAVEQDILMAGGRRP